MELTQLETLFSLGIENVVWCRMTPTTPNQKQLSSAESRRQLEESVQRAMERYKSDFEAVRANSERLREAREARDEAVRDEAQAKDAHAKPAVKKQAVKKQASKRVPKA